MSIYVYIFLDSQVVEDLLAPLLDETVRRELQLSRAISAGDLNAVAALEQTSSRRSVLLGELRLAVEEERFGAAAELAMALQVKRSTGHTHTHRQRTTLPDTDTHSRWKKNNSEPRPSWP